MSKFLRSPRVELLRGRDIFVSGQGRSPQFQCAVASSEGKYHEQSWAVLITRVVFLGNEITRVVFLGNEILQFWQRFCQCKTHVDGLCQIVSHSCKCCLVTTIGLVGPCIHHISLQVSTFERILAHELFNSTYRLYLPWLLPLLSKMVSQWCMALPGLPFMGCMFFSSVHGATLNMIQSINALLVLLSSSGRFYDFLRGLFVSPPML